MLYSVIDEIDADEYEDAFPVASEFKSWVDSMESRLHEEPIAEDRGFYIGLNW